MQNVKYFLLVLMVFAAPFVSTYRAGAISPSLLISQVQLGGSGSGTAGQEFVEVYNNSDADIMISGWSLMYVSSSGGQSTLLTINSADQHSKVWLKSRSYATFVSLDYKTASGYSGDGLFSYNGGMSATGGKVRLLDTSAAEIDKVSWGSGTPEPSILSPPAGKVIQRLGDKTLQDTDSFVDFVLASPVLHTSGVYEVIPDICPNINGAQQVVPTGYILNNNGECVVPPPVDVCPNISDLQVDMPTGYLHDNSGNCQVDSCRNIDGLQISVPERYDADAIGNCTEHDECPNISGAQYIIPIDFIKNSNGNCMVDAQSLSLTEILPNVSGTDTGKEYIELYNNGDKPIYLQNYLIRTGVDLNKTYTFPNGSMIQPGQYSLFKDTDLGFVLGNSSGRVTLETVDGQVVSDTGIYMNAADDQAWAQIGGVWQYTAQPTPGSENTLPIEDQIENGSESSSSILAACPVGKYRNQLTNRCRNIESDASVLSSCGADQYRNPDTGRCRKIVSASTVTPCKEGQYRSEETNRCRNITAANSTLAACKEGQERNPDTNRCRTVTSKSIPSASYAVEPVKDSTKAFVGWWAMGGIGTVALGYAGWEWRREVSAWIRRIVTRDKV